MKKVRFFLVLLVILSLGLFACHGKKDDDDDSNNVPQKFCGNNNCDEQESCLKCPADCGECPPPNHECGDNNCDATETCLNCSKDCGDCPPGDFCGDTICNGTETCSTCPFDCGNCPPPSPFCGDHDCNGTETCSSCPGDCGACPPVCGDGSCNGTETCSSCPGDCGTCPPPPPVCGDTTCNGTETCSTCPVDCGVCPPACGDGSCNGTETCSSCPGDCGVCPPVCGDGSCNGTETCSSCPGDCGTCPPPPPVCGDGSCNGTETCSSCPGDCGTCPPVCGDGSCNGTETCSSCPGDCGVCPPVCGDWICETPETCSTCQIDCGPCPPAITYTPYGFNFSPFVDGQDPNYNVLISKKQLTGRMKLIVPYTQIPRSFGSTNGLEQMCNVAYELGFKDVYLGAWLGKNLTANATEITNLINQVKSCPFAYSNVRVIVGSEVLLRNDLTEDQLIAYINQVRTALPGVKVTTADIYSFILSRPKIIAAVDFLFVNYYPYWEGTSLQYSVANINNWHQSLITAAGGKEVLVSETGWPSCGNTINEAAPTPENAAFYFKNFVSWARAKNVKYFYFEALDESWKKNYEGPQGECWGVFDKYGAMKTGMIDVFDGITMPDNWTCGTQIDGPGTPDISFTYVPPKNSNNNLQGKVSHVAPRDYKVAIYIKVGAGWWTKPTWASPKTNINCDGTWTTDITTGGIDATASQIAAYLIPSSFSPPLATGGSTLAIDTDANVVDKIIVTR